MNILNEKKIFQYFRNFEKAITLYQFDIPFSRFLVHYYKQNKQMGSSDRRMNSRLCYNYFRLGKALLDQPLLDRLVVAEFLMETASDFVMHFRPEWSALQNESIHQKVRFLDNVGLSIFPTSFPLIDSVSDAIDKESFLASHFKQPALFIRIKKGFGTQVRKALDELSLPYTQLSEHTLSLNNGANLQNLKGIEGKYEVQDLSSQSTLAFIDAESGESWWDCCAASGGKSLMLLDHVSDIQLLVSDVRLSILRNLDERFLTANIKTPYRKKVIDLTASSSILGDEMFDGILLDAPCSGSGTWGRTPEMISKFEKTDIKYYTTLQRSISKTVVKHLKPGSPLIYITCSVFKQENEDVVDYIVKELGLTLVKQQVLKGYDKQADSMFVARLVK